MFRTREENVEMHFIVREHNKQRALGVIINRTQIGCKMAQKGTMLYNKITQSVPKPADIQNGNKMKRETQL